MQAAQGSPTVAMGMALSQPSSSGAYPSGSPTVANNQPAGMYMQQPVPGGQVPGMNNQAMYPQYPHPAQNPQQMGIYPNQMQSGQMGYMYPQQMYGNQMASYGYGYGYPGYSQGPQQNAQYLQQSMSGLTVRDDSALRNSGITPSYVPPSARPSKPEDKLFGDLVDISKFKPGKSTQGRAGSM